MERRSPPVTATLIPRLTRALNRYLPQAIAGDSHATHQARVASRRLREAVPVLADGLKGARAGKTTRRLRKLTRALGSVRELDVTLGLVEELAQADVPRAAVEDVRAHVLAERLKNREAMLGRLDRLDPSNLNRRLAAVSAAVAQAADESWRDRLASRILARTQRLSSAVDAAGQMYAPEQLHMVRIAAKKLRYALELAAETGTRSAARHVRTLKRVQDLLGRLHDLQVLAHNVSAVQAAPAPGAAAGVQDMERLATDIEGTCRRQHARYLATVEILRELVVLVHEEIIPALARPNLRHRTLKMTLPAATARAAGSRR